MTVPDPSLKVATGAERTEVAAMIGFLEQVTAPMRGDEAGLPDPNGTAKLMCALTVFAGGLCGEMIAKGIVNPRLKRRMAHSAASYFRTGIQAGLSQISIAAAGAAILNVKAK